MALAAQPTPAQPCSNGDGASHGAAGHLKPGSVVVAPAGAYREAGPSPGLGGMMQPREVLKARGSGRQQDLLTVLQLTQGRCLVP